MCARRGTDFQHQDCGPELYLKAFFIEQSRHNFDAIKQTIDGNACAKGWLIFATHDVCDQPTRFGCSARFFRKRSWSTRFNQRPQSCQSLGHCSPFLGRLTDRGQRSEIGDQPPTLKLRRAKEVRSPSSSGASGELSDGQRDRSSRFQMSVVRCP